jgi:hypothetical protein
MTDGPLEQLADLRQHLDPGIRILELVVELRKAHEFDWNVALLQGVGHSKAVLDPHIGIEVAMNEEHRSCDPPRTLERRSFFC